MKGKSQPSGGGETPTVVGIGASAGGLAALRTFFERVPPDSGLAFVIVVHLSPQHESHLADLLQPHVKMPVRQVAENTLLEANQVYVIPPNANLNAIDTHLRLSALEEERRERAPIDHFLRTLASTHDGNAIAVILTGTGSDGTLGIKDVKAKGGLIVVQDPHEAEYDGMPQSAIATGMVDLILPTAQIPNALLRFHATTPHIPIALDERSLPKDEAHLLQKVLAQLRARTERDFSRYKRSTLLRRIARRMQLNYLEDLEAYLERLREHPEEVRALADDLLITVTNFFRDAEVFDKLEKDVVPRLFDGKGSEDAIRVWSVGCATGEEAYSLAILLLEEAERREDPPRIQVFASDLHTRSLAQAREGFYPGDIATDVHEERLKRFFQKENGGYRVHKGVRDLVVFAPHNLLGDPPFSRLDLICCRNLLIYLQRDVQRDVIDLFHYALKPHGYLLLGSAETIDATELFRTEDKNLRLHAKRNVPAPEPRLPVFPLTRLRPDRPEESQQIQPEPVAYRTLLQRTLEQYAPPSLLIDSDNKLAQIAGGGGRYLIHPSGNLTSNVFKLIRHELRFELRAALQSMRESKSPVDVKPIPVGFNGTPVLVRTRLQPITEPGHEGCALVMFEEVGAPPEPESGKAQGSQGTKPLDDERLAELEAELNITRQRLQAVIEEYETSQEEMKAAYEEMQSTNEELRSTMEELETSKEELQSINEELQTVNQENRHKVEELAQLSSDLQNLLIATDIATLFLDRNLRILRFTPRIGELFNMRLADRGRPLSDLTHRLGYDDLRKDSLEVLKGLIPVEREVQDDDGRSYLARVLPYRSAEDRIEGVVITFVDITRRVQAEREVRAGVEKLRQSEERYRLLVESAREYAILLIDLEGHVTSWNKGAERTFGYSEKEILGRPLDDLFTEEDRAAGVPERERETARREGAYSDDRWQVRKDGTRFWASGAMEALMAPDGTLRCFAKVLRDNTERKTAEESLHRLTAMLETRVEERTREVRELSARLTMAEHQERDRIARILHDDLQQLLYSAKIQLMFVREALDPQGRKDLAERVAKTEEMVQEGVEIAQGLAIELSPQVLQKEGLREMLRWLGDQMKEQQGLQVGVSARDSFPAPKALRVLLYQAIRELLFNVVKHSGVNQATVKLSRNKSEFLIAVADKGKGFDPEGLPDGDGFGVSNIGHRLSLIGGRLEVESAPGKGATVRIAVPRELFDERDP